MPEGAVRASSPGLLADRVLRVAALAAFGASLLYTGIPLLWRSVRGVDQALALAGEDAAAVRVRVFGVAWARGIGEIRATIPRNDSYSLISAGQQWEGNDYWVRFELAPRRAHFLGWTDQLRTDGRPRVPEVPDPWVVVAFHQPQPPLLLSRQAFLDSLEHGNGWR